jgi:hypothetical protein
MEEIRLRTYTGRLVHVLRESLDRYEIAHGLSRIVRFCGQTPRPETVAEHSFWVAYRIWKETGDRKKAFVGLLHDASEALLQDIPAPLKAFLPDYRRIERIFQSHIYEAHGADFEICQEAVKKADMEQLAEEESVHFGRSYEGKRFCLEPSLAEQLWLAAYRCLCSEGDLETIKSFYYKGEK